MNNLNNDFTRRPSSSQIRHRLRTLIQRICPINNTFHGPFFHQVRHLFHDLAVAASNNVPIPGAVRLAGTPQPRGARDPVQDTPADITSEECPMIKAGSNLANDDLGFSNIENVRTVVDQ